ncbi:unnamed protein product [Boreogadus saida]
MATSYTHSRQDPPFLPGGSSRGIPGAGEGVIEGLRRLTGGPEPQGGLKVVAHTGGTADTALSVSVDGSALSPAKPEPHVDTVMQVESASSYWSPVSLPSRDGLHEGKPQSLHSFLSKPKKASTIFGL